MVLRATDDGAIQAPLAGYRVLVIEDEYFLADDIARALEALGAVIAGPVGVVADALDLLRGGETLHGAVVDINLWSEMSFAVVRLLRARGLPLVHHRICAHEYRSRIPGCADMGEAD